MTSGRKRALVRLSQNTSFVQLSCANTLLYNPFSAWNKDQHFEKKKKTEEAGVGGLDTNSVCFFGPMFRAIIIYNND